MGPPTRLSPHQLRPLAAYALRPFGKRHWRFLEAPLGCTPNSPAPSHRVPAGFARGLRGQSLLPLGVPRNLGLEGPEVPNPSHQQLSAPLARFPGSRLHPEAAPGPGAESAAQGLAGGPGGRSGREHPGRVRAGQGRHPPPGISPGQRAGRASQDLEVHPGASCDSGLPTPESRGFWGPLVPSQ